MNIRLHIPRRTQLICHCQHLAYLTETLSLPIKLWLFRTVDSPVTNGQNFSALSVERLSEHDGEKVLISHISDMLNGIQSAGEAASDTIQTVSNQRSSSLMKTIYVP
ncbi:Nicotinamidase [Rubrivivax sp. A210]|nr:Nicotinamidase [Rubrivivax sp. A210]